MEVKVQTFETQLGGRRFVVEYGKVAKQANAAVIVKYGDTVVLASATQSEKVREVDFFPLMVDYEEKFYSVGKIPGGFFKREGRPSEAAILACRLIDRPLRPLFDSAMRNDVQVVTTVLSVDKDNSPDVTAMIGASCALSISDIPFAGPVAGVRVGLINDKFIINPNILEQEASLLNLVVAGTYEAVLMVEAGANELSEDVILDAIMFGHEAVKEIVNFQKEIVAKIGKAKKEIVLYEPEAEIKNQVWQFGEGLIREAVYNSDKQLREEKISEAKKTIKEHFALIYPENFKDVDYIVNKMLKEVVRKMITEDKIRPDGRGLEEVRPISCEVAILPRTHGSALFTRGQTQVLNVTTLGAIGDEQIVDGIGVEDSKRYMHHYNFPPYSVGEVRPLRSAGRREIGHGALAERALVPVLPKEEDFPYTLRLVSEVLESNGSSSMASVCGSTLSLMDAGVPLTAPVSGVAMGLVKNEDKYTILTDIQGMEDALGDMDFKVAGTSRGITAIQMDIKVDGLSRDILRDALAQAFRGRAHILQEMMKTIAQPRQELSVYAPRIIVFNIDKEKIREVIGPGGKVIRKIVEETEVKIDIDDDGKVFIAAVDALAGEKAQKMIQDLLREVEVGEIYKGKVMRLMDFGAFVEVLPGKEGLVHISQLAEKRVNKVTDVVKIGDELLVKVTEIDRQGRINLSHRATLKDKQ